MEAAFGIGGRFKQIGVWQHVHGGVGPSPCCARISALARKSKSVFGRCFAKRDAQRKRPPRKAAFGICGSEADQRE
jgi:hypothetical protein